MSKRNLIIAVVFGVLFPVILMFGLLSVLEGKPLHVPTFENVLSIWQSFGGKKWLDDARVILAEDKELLSIYKGEIVPVTDFNSFFSNIGNYLNLLGYFFRLILDYLRIIGCYIIMPFQFIAWFFMQGLLGVFYPN